MKPAYFSKPPKSLTKGVRKQAEQVFAKCNGKYGSVEEIYAEYGLHKEMVNRSNGERVWTGRWVR